MLAAARRRGQSRFRTATRVGSDACKASAIRPPGTVRPKDVLGLPEDRLDFRSGLEQSALRNARSPLRAPERGGFEDARAEMTKARVGVDAAALVIDLDPIELA